MATEYENKDISLDDIKTIMCLDEEVALKVYGKCQIQSETLFIEYIVSTTLSALEKIEKSLAIFSNKYALSIEEVGLFMGFMMPYETSDSWERKARALLQKNQVDLAKSVSKELIINLMLEYRMIFRF